MILHDTMHIPMQEEDLHVKRSIALVLHFLSLTLSSACLWYRWSGGLFHPLVFPLHSIRCAIVGFGRYRSYLSLRWMMIFVLVGRECDSFDWHHRQSVNRGREVRGAQTLLLSLYDNWKNFLVSLLDHLMTWNENRPFLGNGVMGETFWGGKHTVHTIYTKINVKGVSSFILTTTYIILHPYYCVLFFSFHTKHPVKKRNNNFPVVQPILSL